MKKSSALTPVMKQYWEVKSSHPDKIVLFQMGDFYEMFYKDAQIASGILNIALTARNKKAVDIIPMCGVPLSTMPKTVSQLLARGHKAVICEQLEDSASKKGLVRREVTRVLSPGMAYDPSFLDELKAHYICAFDSNTVSFSAFAEGEAFYYNFSTAQELERLILMVQPVEIIFREDQRGQIPTALDNTHLTIDTDSVEEFSKNIPSSALRLLSYIKKTGGPEALKGIRKFEKRYTEKNLFLSHGAVKHLEIVQTFEGRLKGSLFSAVNRTKTFSGARKLKQCLMNPLADISLIEKRLNRVEFFFKNEAECGKVRGLLETAGDLERKVGKINYPSAGPRDLLSLGKSLEVVFLLLDSEARYFFEQDSLEPVRELARGLVQDIREDAPLSASAGGIFKKGAESELNSLIEWSENAGRLTADMENREKQRSQIPSLKIRRNQVFGFYIEITKANVKKAPAYYFRKQTLSQAERYTTRELQELEQKITAAEAKRTAKEHEMFKQRLDKVRFLFPELHRLARFTAELDVSSSLAFLASERNYTRPRFTQNSICIKNSRHPVIEQERPFIPNTISMEKGECLLLTGPNMAGKSTLMRQTALNVLLAQSGSFVPAEQAQLPVFKKLFTRVGAGDLLHSGLSTFMVEMKEAGEIVHHADEKSLIILDELGRGTSTYDGLSLAQALLEYMIEKNKSYILFSTHYHELTRLKQTKIKQGHMAVQETQSGIDFLYTLRSGASQRSYGIDVGRKAGLPSSVIERARELIQRFEKTQTPLENVK